MQRTQLGNKGGVEEVEMLSVIVIAALCSPRFSACGEDGVKVMDE